MAFIFDDSQLRKTLNREQFDCTRRKGTEEPFTNEYWNNFKVGVYKCIVCDSPLFSSENKYQDGFGWPAFYDELPQADIKKEENNQLDYPRDEAICNKCNSHLGYVFSDGPKDKTGKRYVINSSSLRFYQGDAN